MASSALTKAVFAQTFAEVVRSPPKPKASEDAEPQAPTPSKSVVEVSAAAPAAAAPAAAAAAAKQSAPAAVGGPAVATDGVAVKKQRTLESFFPKETKAASPRRDSARKVQSKASDSPVVVDLTEVRMCLDLRETFLQVFLANFR